MRFRIRIQHPKIMRIQTCHPAFCLLKYSPGVFLVFYVLYLTLSHLPPLTFFCVGGCWDRAQECCNFSIGRKTRFSLHVDFPCMLIFLFSGGLVATASSASRNEAGDCRTSICKEDKALLLSLELTPCYILFVIVSQSFDHCQSLLLL